MTEYVTFDCGDPEEEVYAYPVSAPYVQRDQERRTADDAVRVVIGDVAHVLRAHGDEENARKTDALYAETCALFDKDGDRWCRDGDASETLQGILSEAENLPGIFVRFDGDCDTVWTTIADRWRTLTADKARAHGCET